MAAALCGPKVAATDIGAGFKGKALYPGTISSGEGAKATFLAQFVSLLVPGWGVNDGAIIFEGIVASTEA